MIKIAFRLIRILFWLQAFAAPLLIFGLLAFVVYSKGEHNKWIAIFLLAPGTIAGTVLAEWILRRYGLETFFTRIYGSPELDDSEKKEN
jgi:hypothetical protein